MAWVDGLRTSPAVLEQVCVLGLVKGEGGAQDG
eukprot:CAMPEP_0119369972 /NCGR_PEP_ID=MMETSP1334-20130426/16413_1 /TAXON_ID=127549 /ORGANISM="Calcidiscus leptoporus, Strain RCC1130" /LENGTH=32 /DNA_ID= /DNA_START= /DNA_END= /DNA_ORIENTATION=